MCVCACVCVCNMCVIVKCVKYAHFVKVQLTSCTQTCSNGCVNVHCDILTSVHMYRCFHDCLRVSLCVFVCVCVSVYERKRVLERQQTNKQINTNTHTHIHSGKKQML